MREPFKNINQYFLKGYHERNIFIQKKTEILINSVFFCLLFLCIIIVLHISNGVHWIFVLFDLIFLFTSFLSLYLVRKHFFEEAANFMILGITLTIFIQNVVRDFLLGQDLTYYRFLETEILYIAGLLVVSLFAYKNYQIYLFILLGFLVIVLHFFSLIYVFYDNQFSFIALVDFIIYALAFILCGYFANNIFILYNRFLYISDKQTKRIKAFNKELRKKVKERTFLLEEQNHKLTKVNEELDKFVYSVSHDLRSPLTSVLGLVYLAKMELENQTPNINAIAQYLDLLQKSVNKLDNLIKDIIDLSKNARVEILPEPLRVNTLVEEVFEENRFLSNCENIKKIIEDHQIEDFHTDRVRLKIILSNLISNAIKYSNKEDAYIKISISILKENGLELLILIEDNGEGVGKEHLDKIFNMFYRASTQKHGSGLGLYIVKESILKLKGSIQVESKLNELTRFEIRIPDMGVK